MQSILAKDTKTKEDVQLLIENHQLIVIQSPTPPFSQSSTVETKEKVDLELIYSIDYALNLLSIYFIEKQLPVSETDDDKKTLTNIRPQDTQWHLRTLRFTLDNDNFVTQLQKIALPHRNQLSNTKIAVVMNPTSGLRLAETYWKTIVQPMLVTAGFNESNISISITEGDGKTRALAKTIGERILTASDQDSKPIVIAMGGDGTIHEVINGLKDLGHGNFRLGVIPAGSGNAFALGLSIENVEHATLKIIKGIKEESFYLMDVQFGHSNVDENWQQKIDYDHLKEPIRLLVVMSWGFHAQIVSKSRYLRYFMGNKRFSLVAMFLLKFLHQYEGELVLKNPKKYDSELEKFVDNENDVVLDGRQPNKGFTYFIASKQPSLEKGFNIAPFASSLTNDIDIVLMRGVDAETLTKASIHAFQGGVHVKSDEVEYFKTSDLLLRVKQKAEICLDGEIHSLPVNGVLHLKTIGSTTTESSITVFV